MRPFFAFLGGVALLLAACASTQNLGAAGDVHALLIAIRDDDRPAFEAHIDRPALQREIEYRMSRELAGSKVDPTLKLLGAVLAPTAAGLAGDALIQPGAFRMVAAQYGYRPSMKIPGPIAISTMLRRLDDGRVCATRRKDGPCLLVFSRDPYGTWRLSGFEGDLSELRRKF